MKVLLDTYILLWFAYAPHFLSRRARHLLAIPDQDYVFSVVSVREIAIKQALHKPGFQVDASSLREGLLVGGMEELAVQSSHAIAVGQLPWLHHDPFDRLLIAQTLVEDFTFATADETLGGYSPRVKYIG